MKRVFENRMVAHVWAQQNQPEGRSSNGQFYFDGDTIYSYGSHFPIARFVTNDRGERAVLFTTRTYSPTTRKHISFTRQALPRETKILYVERPTYPPEQSFGMLHKDMNEAIKAFANIPKRAPAKRSAAIQEINSIILHANALKEFFDLDVPRLTMPENFEEYVKDLAEKAAAWKKAQEEKAEKERKQKEKSAVKVKEAWVRHIPTVVLQRMDYPVDHSALLRYGPVMMRVTKDGESIETTQGAVFPLSHGKKAYRILKRIKASGQEWHRNGKSIHLGHFQIDHVDINGNVRAGCHTVAWEEIERLGKELGLEDCTDEADEEVSSGG